MEEEELDIWFDEEKEKLSEQFQKQVSNLLVSEEYVEDKKLSSLTVEEREKMREKAQQDYLEEIRRLRARYRKEYSRIKSKQAAKKHASTAKEHILSPLAFVFRPIWRVIKSAALGTWKGITFVFGTFGRGLKRTVSDGWYGWKNLYQFHLKHYLPFLGWFARKFKLLVVRPWVKGMDAYKDIKKATITKTMSGATKAFTKTLEMAKTVWGKFMERYKKVAAVVGKVWKVVSAIFKKIFGPLFSLIGKLLAKFKKSDEGDEE